MGAVGLMCVGFVGCDNDPPAEAPMGFTVRALTGTACGDPTTPIQGTNPFTDISRVTIEVTGPDVETGEQTRLARTSRSLDGATSLTIANVIEGPDREVTLLASGSTSEWHARQTDVTIRRNTDNNVDLLLTKRGAMNCVPSPQTMTNTMFPAAVRLGNGDVLITGGFTASSATALSAPSDQGFIFDSRTGAIRSVGSMGAGAGRAGHAMVYLPRDEKVLIVGGMTELAIDSGAAFPFVFDASKALDDYVVFDTVTETFARGTETMRLPRAFPKAHALTDGTAVVTGGGPWPISDTDVGYREVEIFDPEDNGGNGGLLDLPGNFASFYYRAGHSLTFLEETDEGLSRLLVWGGSVPQNEVGSPPRWAEVFTQSGQQRESVNGSFERAVFGAADETNLTAPDFTYFHAMTPLGNKRFLLTGGAPVSGGELKTPADNSAYLLTFIDGDTPLFTFRHVPGLGAGRAFHTAVKTGPSHVSVLGGMVGSGAVATNKSMLFDFSVEPAGGWFPSAADAAFVPRVGHAALALTSGSVIVIGGETIVTDPLGGGANIEIFTPSILPVP